MAVKLRRLAPITKDTRRLKGTRIRVEVVETDGQDSDIFVWQSRGVSQYYDNANIDIPIGVCTLGDMLELPANAPVGDSPFFRRNYLDFHVRTNRIADDVWDTIVQDVNSLVEATARSTFDETKQVWLTSGSGSSSSSS